MWKEVKMTVKVIVVRGGHVIHEEIQNHPWGIIQDSAARQKETLIITEEYIVESASQLNGGGDDIVIIVPVE